MSTARERRKARRVTRAADKALRYPADVLGPGDEGGLSARMIGSWPAAAIRRSMLAFAWRRLTIPLSVSLHTVRASVGGSGTIDARWSTPAMVSDGVLVPCRWRLFALKADPDKTAAIEPPLSPLCTLGLSAVASADAVVESQFNWGLGACGCGGGWCGRGRTLGIGGSVSKIRAGGVKKTAIVRRPGL